MAGKMADASAKAETPRFEVQRTAEKQARSGSGMIGSGIKRKEFELPIPSPIRLLRTNWIKLQVFDLHNFSL